MRYLRLLLAALVIPLAELLRIGSITPASPPEPLVAIPGHVHALPGAVAVGEPEPPTPATVTLVLRHDDEDGFARHLRGLADPSAPSYRRFLSQRQIADRFGPSPTRYAALRRHLETHGLAIVEEAANRLTLTARGRRDQIEAAFAVDIRDWRWGDRVVSANVNEPSLPASLAAGVRTVAGLNTLPRLGHAYQKFQEEQLQRCIADLVNNYGLEGARRACTGADPNKPQNGKSRAGGPIPTNWLDADGSGQTVGIVAFDTFDRQDVVDYLALADLPTSLADQVSTVHLNGEAAPGPEQAEVLLDVLSVLTVAPGASVVVYDSPFIGFGRSFQSIFNRMVNDGVDVISNSWIYCEDHTTAADVQGIDAILQQAALSNIAVFSATGDYGNTCLGTSPPGTAAVPTSSPHLTAVGGSSLQMGPDFTYVDATWWDDAGATPPGGSGGFGVSKFFARPAYQNGLNPSAMRSVPDVVANADPRNGFTLCQASAGGCPTGSRYAGTSSAAPLWAGFAALLNQAQGENLGPFNTALYPLAGTDAFHDATDMSSDFAHVGLGSPNLNVVHVALAGKTVGAVSASVSQIFTGDGAAPADGVSPVVVVVRLRDASGNTVSGKTVTLAPNGGSGAVVTPPSGVTNVANGAVVFEVTNLDAEAVTLTATDTTGGVTLAAQPTVEFAVPPAANAGITASPSPVNADGMSTTTITVTLTDALDRPTPGKEIRLSQGSGHSVITGPVPPVTGADGKISFTATNTVNETVTYTAVDVSDGDLPVPGNAPVVFQNGANNSCVATITPPTGANGYQVSAFATGFVAQNFFFGGINFVGCPGISLPAFVGNQVFAAEFPTGKLYRFDAAGGAATTGNVVTTHPQTLNFPTIGKDGKLYAAFSVTNEGGKIVEIDPTSGAIVRTLAQNLACPNGLTVDPLSGDLFFANSCSGFLANPSIYRLNPTAQNATPTVYATTSGTPNGQIVFAPNGTLYVTTRVFDASPPVARITGTDQPQPATVTSVAGVASDFWLAIAAVGPDGDATAFLVNDTNKLQRVEMADPASATTLANGAFSPSVIGPDGCVYGAVSDTIYKLTDADGGCGFIPKSGSPALTLDPPSVTPDPEQGTTRTFTATFRNVTVPEGTPVFLDVTGANPELRVARTDATGTAVFAYTGVATGNDVAFAYADIESGRIASNRVRLAWAAGAHVTSLSINLTPAAGPAGTAFAAIATLLDRSVQPPIPVAGATIDMTVGGEQCSATTDADGLASCALTPTGEGLTTFTATFAGTPQHRSVSVSRGFNVLNGPALGPFVLYTTATTKNAAKFFKFGSVTLADGALGVTSGYDVVRPLALGLPANLGGLGFTDAETHLAAYAVKTAKGAAKFPKRADLAIATDCGGLVVTATKPAALLAPAAESDTTPVTPPADTNVDHFLCYAAKVQKKRGDGTPAPAFPKRAQLDVADHFQTRRYDLKKVAWVCDAITTSGTPALLAGPQKGTPYPITPATVTRPAARLVCYTAKPAKKTVPQLACGAANATDKGTPLVQAKHAPVVGLHVASTLETRRLDTKKELMICLPSS